MPEPRELSFGSERDRLAWGPLSTPELEGPGLWEVECQRHRLALRKTQGPMLLS